MAHRVLHDVFDLDIKPNNSCVYVGTFDVEQLLLPPPIKYQPCEDIFLNGQRLNPTQIQEFINTVAQTVTVKSIAKLIVDYCAEYISKIYDAELVELTVTYLEELKQILKWGDRIRVKNRKEWMMLYYFNNTLFFNGNVTCANRGSMIPDGVINKFSIVSNVPIRYRCVNNYMTTLTFVDEAKLYPYQTFTQYIDTDGLLICDVEYIRGDYHPGKDHFIFKLVDEKQGDTWYVLTDDFDFGNVILRIGQQTIGSGRAILHNGACLKLNGLPENKVLINVTKHDTLKRDTIIHKAFDALDVMGSWFKPRSRKSCYPNVSISFDVNLHNF